MQVPEYVNQFVIQVSGKVQSCLEVAMIRTPFLAVIQFMSKIKKP